MKFALTIITLAAVTAFPAIDAVDRRPPSVKAKVPSTIQLRGEVELTDDIAAEQARYFIQIIPDRNRYRLTEAMTAEIRITCREQSITFTNAPNPFENFRFTLFDERNNRVMPSHQYTLWQYKEGINGIAGGDRCIVIRPGETFAMKINLASFFAVERTGRYRIEGIFNPSPNDPDTYRITVATAYCFIDEAATGESSIAVAAEKKDDIPVLAPTGLPPYEVVAELFAAQQRRDWGNYFRNIHLPSFVMISSRYHDYYIWKFGPAKDTWTDLDAGRRYANANLSNALFKKFGDDTSLLQMKKEYGDAYVDNLVNAYTASPVSVLALALEAEYLKKLPVEKKAFFAEYRKYIASRYDRDVRFHFLRGLEQRAYDAGYVPAKSHGTHGQAQAAHGADAHGGGKVPGHGGHSAAQSEGERLWAVKTAIENENRTNEYYELKQFDIQYTMITNANGIPTAYVQTKVVERFADDGVKHEYKPTSLRFFTLKKLGDHWWVVDYFDTILPR